MKGDHDIVFVVSSQQRRRSRFMIHFKNLQSNVADHMIERIDEIRVSLNGFWIGTPSSRFRRFHMFELNRTHIHTLMSTNDRCHPMVNPILSWMEYYCKQRTRNVRCAKPRPIRSFRDMLYFEWSIICLRKNAICKILLESTIREYAWSKIIDDLACVFYWSVSYVE